MKLQAVYIGLWLDTVQETTVHPATNLTAEGHSSGGLDSESVSAHPPPGRKDTTV